MHTSSKKGPRMIAEGSQYTDPRSARRSRRSSLQHLDSPEGAERRLIHGPLAVSERTLSVRRSEVHRRREAVVNTAAASSSICFGFGPSLKTSTGQVVSVTPQRAACAAAPAQLVMLTLTGLAGFAQKTRFLFFRWQNKILIRFPGAANAPALIWMHQRDPGWRERAPRRARLGVDSIKAPHQKPKHATNQLQRCGRMTPLLEF